MVALTSPADLQYKAANRQPSATRCHPRSLSMATLTVSSVRSQLGASAQYVSSPLAGPSHASVVAPPRQLPRHNPHFAPSRPIRPFASISQNATRSSVKPVKLIEPPKNFKTTFILDLTQEEFGRQD